MSNIIKAIKNFGLDFFNYKAEICYYGTVGENIETTDFILQAIHKIIALGPETN
jgi:hypothetical protein